jgi:hypothetical protein
MKRLTMVAALGAIGMLAVPAVADQSLVGSDTLEFVMRDIVIACEANANDDWNGTAENGGVGAGDLEISILAGGSGDGEDALERNSGERITAGIAQQIAQMSRALDTNACTDSPALPGANPAYAPYVHPIAPQQAEVGIDKLLVPMGNCGADDTSCPAGEACVNNICSKSCVTNADCDVYPTKDPLTCVSNRCVVPVDAACPLDTFGDVSDSGSTWGHNLRVLFFGWDNATSTYNCMSAERQNLAEDCNLYHIYRRDDSSGTTDVFKSLLGVPATQAFCNDPGQATAAAGDNEKNDLDPIRRACDNGEDVCRCDGTLGLLLPMTVPAVPAGFPVNVLYPDRPCAGGMAVITGFPGNDLNASGVDPQDATPKFGNHCSGGERRYTNGCIFPLSDPASGLSPSCMFTNRADAPGDPLPSPLLEALRGVGRDPADAPWVGSPLACPVAGYSNDERAFNLDVRVPAGVAVQGGFVNPVKGAILAATSGTDHQGHAYNRIHSWDQPPGDPDGGVRNFAAGGFLTDAGCQKLDATIQIGCLVARDAQHNKRSLGYAGLQAIQASVVDTAGIDKLAYPIRLDSQPYTQPIGTYPFARKLYINALYSWATIEENKYGVDPRGNLNNGDELSLARCIAASDNVTSTIVQQAVVNNGYELNALAPNGGAVVTPTTPACGN